MKKRTLAKFTKVYVKPINRIVSKTSLAIFPRCKRGRSGIVDVVCTVILHDRFDPRKALRLTAISDIHDRAKIGEGPIAEQRLANDKFPLYDAKSP